LEYKSAGELDLLEKNSTETEEDYFRRLRRVNLELIKK
jgi:hypothetical protein